jgi:hypothetical protein
MNHITRELEKLTMHERYGGTDQVQTANGAAMDIVHIGKSVLPTPTRPLHLKHVLHVSRAHKQLVSIHRFNLDNSTFNLLNYICSFSPCRGGLYPLPPLSSPT